MTEPRFFATPAAFGKWLAAHHAKQAELWVGFHKVATGRPSLTWAQAVEAALAWGWIDGLRKSLGAEAYMIRFTPRKPGSHWSAVNVRTAQRLVAEGKMQPAGQAAFAARSEERTAKASFEQGDLTLPPACERAFRRNRAAWAWFSKQAPASYRKAATWWLLTAKKPETQARRLEQLIAYGAKREPVPQYAWRRKTA